MSESDLLKLVQIEATINGDRLFRNNVGRAWAGDFIAKIDYDKHFFLRAGDIVLRSARPLHSGLGVGSSDLIGWTNVQIVPEKNPVAVFTACEIKTPYVKVTPEQQNFINAVQSAGGIGMVVRSIEEYKSACDAARKILQGEA